MSFLQFLSKRKPTALSISDDAIVAPADGQMISITSVADPIFSEKKLGDGVAFRYKKEKVTLCSPANGILSVLFPTGHAFGITMADGVEILVHCGIDTVEALGHGFAVCDKKQGNMIKAGEPIVVVDVEALDKKYDMTTMLIITNSNEHEFLFKQPMFINRGESIIE